MTTTVRQLILHAINYPTASDPTLLKLIRGRARCWPEFTSYAEVPIVR